MCQGLTSAGGSVPDGIAENQVVAIYVEGKEHALAIGTTILSSDNMFVLHIHSIYMLSVHSYVTVCCIKQSEGQPWSCSGQSSLPQRWSLDFRSSAVMMSVS